MSHVIVLFSCHTVFDFTASLSFCDIFISRTQVSGGLVHICDSPCVEIEGYSITFLISSLCPKHCVAGLPLRVGLMQAT